MFSILIIIFEAHATFAAMRTAHEALHMPLHMCARHGKFQVERTEIVIMFLSLSSHLWGQVIQANLSKRENSLVVVVFQTIRDSIRTLMSFVSFLSISTI